MTLSVFIQRLPMKNNIYRLRPIIYIVILLITLTLSSSKSASYDTISTVSPYLDNPRTVKQENKPTDVLSASGLVLVSDLSLLPLPAPTPIVGCGNDPYLAYIYTHESACSTSAINPSSGSCGLGQALPCSKMGCSLSDWVCQNNYFTSYAISTYGSTYNAMLFWESNHWW